MHGKVEHCKILFEDLDMEQLLNYKQDSGVMLPTAVSHTGGCCLPWVRCERLK